VSITARVLVIDPDRESLVELQKALADAGITNVAAVPSGSFALTMIERDRPNLIVSRGRVSDIGGFELCSIVRSDPALSGILFLLLLAGPEEEVPPGALADGPDRVLVGAFTTDTIVSEVVSLLRPEEAAGAAAPDAPQNLRGSLGIMDLPDLTQAIALGGKTGALTLALAAGPGLIVFERGRVVHAEFGALRGERAFTALVATAHRQEGGSFVFSPLEALAPGLPRTITRPVKQLLLDTAAEIDEGRAGPTALAPIS
jgi:CheY-like chemotaxis protein